MIRFVPPSFTEKRWDCRGFRRFRKDEKAVRVPAGVAALVLLGRRSVQFPPFCEGTGP